MLVLVLGIVVFLGVHTLTTFRETRTGLIERFGLGPFKAAYALASIVGFALIVWGFSLYRAEGLIHVWTPPTWTRHHRHPSDVVRLRGAGLHESGAKQDQGLAASPDAGLDQNLGARASARQWRRRRHAAVRVVSRLGGVRSHRRQEARRPRSAAEYHPSRAPMASRSALERWPMWRCCSCIPC